MTFSYSVLAAEHLDFITVFGLGGKSDDTTSMELMESSLGKSLKGNR